MDHFPPMTCIHRTPLGYACPDCQDYMQRCAGIAGQMPTDARDKYLEQQNGQDPFNGLPRFKIGLPFLPSKGFIPVNIEKDRLEEENVAPNVRQLQKLEERINKLEKDNAALLHEVFSTQLNRIDALEEANKMKSEMLGCMDQAYDEERTKLSDRFDKLESLLDVKKMEQIILDGANLHAEILRLSKKLQDAKGVDKKPLLFCRYCGNKDE